MRPRLLKDGTEILVRPLEPDDAELLLEGFESLSPESRYERFFTAMPKLPSHWLDELVDIDHRDREAICAVEPGTGDPIGVARYVRLDGDPHEAEFAVTVIDAWHGRGVGRLLMEELIGAARASGVLRLSGDIHATNEPMLGLAATLGKGVQFGRPHDAIVHVVIPL